MTVCPLTDPHLLSNLADDTVVLGLISNNDETAYLDEVERLTSWCQDNCLSLNVSKTKELIVDFRKRHLLPYTPLMISGTPVERVSSFKYPRRKHLRGPDLDYTHPNTGQESQAKTVPSATAEKIQGLTNNPENFLCRDHRKCLSQCISVWYGNSSSQDCKALQRVCALSWAYLWVGSPLSADIYIKRCRGRADKIIKDSNHPGNCLFTRLPSGKRFRCLMAKTERGVSSPRPSGSWTQSQPLKNIIWLTSNH